MTKTPSIEDLFTIITELQSKVISLQSEVNYLRSKLSKYENPKNSRNSSIPPSKDENKPSRNQSLRQKSGKKPGGQVGRKGNTLKMSENPDQIIQHTPDYCKRCGNDISIHDMEFIGKRQVIDVPPILPYVTEHRIYKRVCNCGHETIADFPENVNASVNYGPNIESFIGYFHARQFIPFKRMQEMFNDIFNLPISEGGIHNLLERLVKKATPAYELIRERVLTSSVIGSDETGIKINGTKAWMWTWQTKLATYIASSTNRGFDTIRQICEKLTSNSLIVHDCWSAHFQTPAKGHQICMAHLLRDLNYIQEKDKQAWSKKLKDVFMDALELKRIMPINQYKNPNNQRDHLEKRLDELLNQAMDKSLKDSVTFQKRLIKYRGSIFTFLYFAEVPPDNNGSERAIRNVKVKQKVSGQFKTIQGADAFAKLRSIMDTAIKNGQNVLGSLNLIASLTIVGD